MKCRVCGSEFEKEHNWGYHGYAVCPLCARKMTERDWDRLMENAETCVVCGEQIPEGRQVCKICEVIQ